MVFNHLLFLIFVLFFTFLNLPTTVQGSPCTEKCCCKVCSTPSNEAYPYGLTTVPIHTNPPNPVIAGTKCHIPVWSDRQYNDSAGHLISTVPDTLFWQNLSYFRDDLDHVAPSTCDCCMISVPTSCSEVRPRATRPRNIVIANGKAITGQKGAFTLTKGVQLGGEDVVQLRTDTHCGYHNALMTFDNKTLNFSKDQTQVRVDLTFPAARCYSVCYYHSGLTTPTWYLIGFLSVNPTPAASVSLAAAPEDVILAGNVVRLEISGKSLLSPFDDIAELRWPNSSTADCGKPGFALRSGNNSDILQVPPAAKWCSPAVIPNVTHFRPLRYIGVKYTDCVPEHRILQPILHWTAKLPSSRTDNNYIFCYFHEKKWGDEGKFLVPKRNTQLDALNALYTATGGANWRYKNWTDSNVCKRWGVRCNKNNEVQKLILSRNNLNGVLPPEFFMSDLALSLTELHLEMNSISGTLDPTFGSMKSLVFADLGFNKLTGTLSSKFAGLDSIEIFYIGTNPLDGVVPENLDKLTLRWFLNSNLSDYVDPDTVPACPTDRMICSDKGSTDPGITQCGFVGITEEACILLGCCFNSQTPLIFGGTSCFTKRADNYLRFPPCIEPLCTENPDVNNTVT